MNVGGEVLLDERDPRALAPLRCLHWEAVDHRSITWIHFMSHGQESDPSKQHLPPLNERASRTG